MLCDDGKHLISLKTYVALVGFNRSEYGEENKAVSVSKFCKMKKKEIFVVMPH